MRQLPSISFSRGAAEPLRLLHCEISELAINGAAIVALARATGHSFQQLTDEAFADLLKKHKSRSRLDS